MSCLTHVGNFGDLFQMNLLAGIEKTKAKPVQITIENTR